MNSIEKLVMMANQIAANRMHEPDPAAATAQHIRLYWDPRMKRLIREHGSAGLSPTAAAATSQLAVTHDAA
jgi:formate dehydrogenase subunit delta